MKLRKWILILGIGGLVAVGVFGLAAYGTARAATARTTVGLTKVSAHAGLDRGFGGGYNNEDLAEALGISVDELNAAYQEANEAALKQAVEAGLITQAQADELRDRGAAFPFGGRWGGWLSQKGIDYEALLADALGISVDDLQAAYAKAFNARIDQAVAGGRITEEQADLMKGRYALYTSENFQSAMRSAFEEAVQQAVSAGVITQAQADAILKNEGGMGFRGFKGLGEWGGFGRGHGGGFGRHGGWGQPGESTPPDAPSESPSGDA